MPLVNFRASSASPSALAPTPTGLCSFGVSTSAAPTPRDRERAGGNTLHTSLNVSWGGPSGGVGGGGSGSVGGATINNTPLAVSHRASVTSIHSQPPPLPSSSSSSSTYCVSPTPTPTPLERRPGLGAASQSFNNNNNSNDADARVSAVRHGSLTDEGSGGGGGKGERMGEGGGRVSGRVSAEGSRSAATSPPHATPPMHPSPLTTRSANQSLVNSPKVSVCVCARVFLFVVSTPLPTHALTHALLSPASPGLAHMYAGSVLLLLAPILASSLSLSYALQ